MRLLKSLGIAVGITLAFVITLYSLGALVAIAVHAFIHYPTELLIVLGIAIFFVLATVASYQMLEPE